MLSWLFVPVAYLLGTFPTAILVGRRRGRDVTREGSGNPGATNALRTMGRRAGVAVLVGDLGKGVLAAATGLLVSHGLAVACGVAAVLGHVAPVTRGFRGGKGVATAAGVVFVCFPLVGLALAVVWAAVVVPTRLSSLASVTIAALLPVGVAIDGRPGREVAAAALVGALVVLRHRENLVRLVRGEERRVGQRGPAA